MRARAFNQKDPMVQLSEEEWREIISDILLAHGEYCISSDNCNCYTRAQMIEQQVNYWIGRET